MKKGCCKDIRVCFKKSSEDQQTQSALHFTAAVIPTEQFDEPVVETTHDVYVPKNIKPSVHAPPPEVRISIYLKNCVFII